MTLKVQPSTGGASTPATPEQLQQIRTDLGLGSVNNTADADKPVSTAQAAADNTRVPKSTVTARGQVLVGLAAASIGALAAPADGAVMVGDPTAAEGVAWLARDARDGELLVLSTDSAAQIKEAVETLLPEQTAGTPFGRGLTVRFPSSEVVTTTMSLSTMQSVKGRKGSPLTFSPSGLADGEYGHLTLLHDSLSHQGLRGNGVLEDLDFRGNRQVWQNGGANPNKVVHGYWAPDRPGNEKCIAHNMRNVAFYGHSGIGVNIGKGNDQWVGERVRVEAAKLWAMRLASSDIKASKLGLNGDGGALWIDGAAVELDTCDFFIPDTFNAECTVLAENATRVQIKGGTCDGRMIFRGRNDQGTTVRYENARMRVRDLVIKHAQALNATPGYAGGSPLYVYDCYFLAEDIDGVTLDGCSFAFDTTLAASALPDYLIGIKTTTGNRARLGVVQLFNAGGLMHLIGRPGDANGIEARMGCKKHWSNEPHLTMFGWGVPGQVEEVPNWACDHPDPTMRTHVRFDGNMLLKERHPFGYLARTINPGGTHGTLDDGNASVLMPELPQLSSWACRAMRVVP